MAGKATIVTDLAWGDSGKGKIANWITYTEDYDISVRSNGGTNCGHSINVKDKLIRTNQLPLAGIMPTRSGKLPELCVGPSVMVDLTKAYREMTEYNLYGRIRIDHRCSLILQKHKDIEASGANYDETHTGSTKQGVGAARLDRVARTGLRICDFPEMEKYNLTNIPLYINDALKNNKKVILEGAQGYKLSLYLSDEYPVVTSCDCTATSDAAAIGLPYNKITDVCAIVKSAPTRVSQKCGVLLGELTKEEILSLGIAEYGVTTGRMRRKSLTIPFDMLEEAVIVNAPTYFALTFCDHVDKIECMHSNCVTMDYIKEKFPNTHSNILELEKRFNIPVKYIEYGKQWNAISAVVTH